MATAFKVHPYCEAFPDLSDAEMKDMALDIQNNGLQNPIWRYGGKIIDGKNRLKACEIAGVKPDFREWSTKSTDPLVIDKELFEFVLSQNEKRRHMDQSQRAMAAARLAKEYEKTHPVVEKKLDTNGEAVEDGKKAEEEVPAINPIDMAANVMGTSPRSVNFATTVVEKGSAALQEAVEQGLVAVSDAAAVAVLDKSDQNEALAKLKAGDAPNLRKAAGKKLRRSKPKPASAEFDDSTFDDLMHDLMAFFNDRVKKFPNKSNHRACTSLVSKTIKEFTAWKKLRK